MVTVFEKINELKKFKDLSKHEQLIDGIFNAIDDKILRKGDQLPSINQMIENIGFARKTIVKAYDELKERGIIGSKSFIGYFLVSEETNRKLRIALILFSFRPFQEVFYNTFREKLGKKVELEVFFHHNNVDTLMKMLTNVSNKYSKYVVAAIEDDDIKQKLESFSGDKLILIDRSLEKMSNHCSSVIQVFEEPTRRVLEEVLILINKYKKFVLFYTSKQDYPPGILTAFLSFVKENQIEAEVVDRYESGILEKNTAYLVINDSDLWSLLKDCAENHLSVGRDIGILSHNDSTIKEIIFGGITTFSTNFEEMAAKTAELVLSNKKANIVLPTRLIDRQSL